MALEHRVPSMMASVRAKRTHSSLKNDVSVSEQKSLEDADANAKRTKSS